MKDFLLGLLDRAVLAFRALARILAPSVVKLKLDFRIPRSIIQLVYKSPTVISAMLILVFMIFAHTSYGQFSRDSLDFSTPGAVFENFEYLYSAIIILGGYFSAFIPGFNKIKSGTYRVLTFAILAGIGFYTFGSSLWPLVMSYASSTSLYELIFKLIKRSPKPDDT